MNYTELGQTIVTLLGGESNVKSLIHCATRLRFKVYDKKLVDVDGLQNTSGVAGIKDQSDGVQVIIGNEVEDVYDAIYAMYNFQESAEVEEDKEPAEGGKKENIFFRVMSWIADCLVPMIPVLIASGLTTAIISLLNAVGLLATDSMTYQILDAVADAVLNFIPFYVVYGAAKKCNVNPMVSFAVIAVLMYDSLWDLAGDATYLTLFGFLPIRVFSYGSTIIPALLCVLTQKYVEPIVHKIVPKMMRAFLEPLLNFLIVVIIMLALFGPIGAWVGDILANLIIAGSQNYAWLICLILAGFNSFLVGMGVHYCMIPAVIMIFSQLGYDNFYGGACMAAAFSLTGAVFAVALKSKNSDTKQVATSTGVTALLGISEPAVYGVFFKYKSCMIGTVVAGIVSGFLAGIFHIKSYAMAPAGLLSIVNYVTDTFVYLIIVIVVAFVLGFVITYILHKDSDYGLEAK